MISQRTLSAAVVVIGAALAFASPAARADGSSWIAELDAGCNAGNSQDCANLGSQLMGGYVVPKDPVRARAAFEKACRLGGMNACVGLYEAPKKRKSGGGLGRIVLLGVVGTAVALVVSEGLRKKVLDALFGAEEEFEYTSTTSTPTPAGTTA